MELIVGTILEGRVKSITSFGAFIALPEGRTGMVHISEIANAYVSDIRQHLTEGQPVKVMVIGTDNGRINLSIKRLEPRPPRDPGGPRGGGPHRDSGPHRDGGSRGNGGPHRDSRDGSPRGGGAPRAQAQPAAPKTSDELFEEKLKAFMTESDSKLSSIRAYSENHSRPRRR